VDEPSQVILVASRNPVKLAAAGEGFRRMLPEITFSLDGVRVDSGVADQPLSDDETRRGAENRARRLHRSNPQCDYAVGIEGGIQLIQDQMYAFAWVVILGRNQSGRSRSGTFLLPPRVQKLVESGQELGHANDAVFSQHNSKQQGGAVGLLTEGVIGRQQLYEHAVQLALIPFKSLALFPKAVSQP